VNNFKSKCFTRGKQHCVLLYGFLKASPANFPLAPSSSSMRKSWLYLAKRSERQGAPVLIWPVRRPTTKSAMVLSSVSPERWETITPHPAAWAVLQAWMLSVTLPIWFTLRSKALQAFLEIPSLILRHSQCVRVAVFFTTAAQNAPLGVGDQQVVSDDLVSLS